MLKINNKEYFERTNIAMLGARIAQETFQDSQIEVMSTLRKKCC